MLSHSAHDNKLVPLSHLYELHYSIYFLYSPYTYFYLSVRVLCFAGPPSCQRCFSKLTCEVRTPLSHVHPDVTWFQILVRTFGAHRGATVKHILRPLFNPLTFIHGLHSIWPQTRDPPHRLSSASDSYNKHRHSTTTPNCIAEIERRHEEELTKLKVDHDQLEARVRHPQGNKQSTHTLSECTQGESPPQCTGNTADYLGLSHMHRLDDAILCRVFSTSFKEAALTI